MNKKRIALILMTTVCIASLMFGCMSKDKVSNVDGNQQSQPEQEKPKLTEKYTNADEAVKQEVKEIKYDLITIIDSARSEDTAKQYPVGVFAPEYVASTGKDTEEVEESEKVGDPDSVKSFLDLTKTAKEDYSDLAIAFNADKGYLVGIVKPATDKKTAVEQAIRKFIVEQAESAKDNDARDNYKKYNLVEYNGHLVIVIALDSSNIKDKIITNLTNIDKLIGEAVQSGFKAETDGSKPKEESTGEKAEEPKDSAASSGDKTEAPKDAEASDKSENK